LGRQLFPHLRHRAQDGAVQVFQEMELADLMRHGTPDRLNRGRIQRGAIRRDALHGQIAGLQGKLKALEKGNDVVLRRIMLQDLEK